MIMYILIAGALFVGGMATSLLGPNPVGAILFPIPIAVYVATHRMERALGLVVCAGAGGFAAATGTISAPVCCVLMAAAGIPFGLGIMRQWTYGWTLAATAAVTYVAVAGGILASWEKWLASANWIAELLLSKQEELRQSGHEVDIAVTQYAQWLQGHWPEVGLGLLVWPLLTGLAVALSVTAAWIYKKFEVSGLRGSFREMRVSEWLVWGAILVAALYFINIQWPGTVPPIVTFNAAITLASIYWFNGLAVLVYMFQALRPNLIVYIALALLLISLDVRLILCLIGLFDTWSNFRVIVDRAVAFRNGRLLDKPDNDE